MANGTIHPIASYESFMNSQRYSLSYQSSNMLQDKCWEQENVPIKSEEPFSEPKEVYSRYQEMPTTHEPSMMASEQYYGPDYSNAYAAAAAPAAYTSFQAPSAVGQRSQMTGLARSLYMPPTPPSSEPGSPSQQQQQQQNRSISHHLKAGPIPTSTVSASYPKQTQQQQQQPSPPPYSCVNGKIVQSHFESQVSPISTVNSGPLHLNNGPFNEGSKVSHTSYRSNGGSTGQYNAAAVMAQITAAAASVTVHPRYNRRNNPELEKRRIHRCDYPG